VQVDDVGVAGVVAVGAGVEVAVGCLVAVEVGGTWVGSLVGGMTSWVLVGFACAVSVDWVFVEGVGTAVPGILQAVTMMANRINMDMLRSVCCFILFPSFWFNHIIDDIMIFSHVYYDVDYTIVVPSKLLVSGVVQTNSIGGNP